VPLLDACTGLVIVDHAGIVIDYEGLWRRIAPA
jgi:hypothetical protein